MLEHDHNQGLTDKKDENLLVRESEPSETNKEITATEVEISATTEPEPELTIEMPELLEKPADTVLEKNTETNLTREEEEKNNVTEDYSPPIPDMGLKQDIPITSTSTPSREETDRLNQELLQGIDESIPQFKRGDIIEGTVVGINDQEVVVDIGFKNDGFISINEFEYSEIPEIDSKIKVLIEGAPNQDNRIPISKKKADFLINIEQIKKAAEEGKTINGTITRRVKGGLMVDVMGIEAFLPGSHISNKAVPIVDQFIGKDMSFKVLRIDENSKNIILSHKEVLEDEANQRKKELLSQIEVGMELDGEVKNITDYGAFIDLGGIDGLLYKTDMSWGTINHPSEMLNIGDKVKVKVIKFDPEMERISLGLKQLVPHPWENVEIKYPEGSKVSGKVVSVQRFGAFVELEPGVEGLVHISEMSWTRKIMDAQKELKVGDTVEAIVLEVDKENHRISLGMRQMEPNPWLYIEDHYPVGSVITRPIKSITPFGAFVEIEDGIDGLIHISDISWTKRIDHPREIFRKGQEVEAVVLSIDRALHRIALGMKQLHPDPWENLAETLPVNSEVKGKISKLMPKGVSVNIKVGEDEVEGFVPISHIAMPKIENTEDAFYVGEELPLKVIEVDMENRRLVLSVNAFFFSRDPRLQEEYIALHEQYMRDRIARMEKKKAEHKARERKRKIFPEEAKPKAETEILDLKEKEEVIPSPADTETPEQIDMSPENPQLLESEEIVKGEYAKTTFNNEEISIAEPSPEATEEELAILEEVKEKDYEVMALSEPSPLNEEIKFEPAIEQKETTEQEGEIPVSESVSSEKINKDSSEENKPEFI
ncbi:MAG: S1 RNA-binding domain-containing protein [Candidatus Cloacimonetes bacterium]|jgi:small subunit ribosomal protein S1|nr:S1 RNA-binding domain-containing protein [Candidatus Cloacimonadota bacterium]